MDNIKKYNSLKIKNPIIKFTRINKIQCDWKNIKNKCRTTVNKEYTLNECSDELKNKLLLSEHSPIRMVTIDWTWHDIPYWVSTELSRHKFEKFISSQRTDRTGIDRNNLPQNAPVNYDGYANAQSIIDMSRKRLCSCATKECIELVRELKISLKKCHCEVADYMCPNCVYRGGCPEFKQCGFWNKFCEDNKDKNLLDLKERYKAYNTWFYNQLEDELIPIIPIEDIKNIQDME